MVGNVSPRMRPYAAQIQNSRPLDIFRRLDGNQTSTFIYIYRDRFSVIEFESKKVNANYFDHLIKYIN